MFVNIALVSTVFLLTACSSIDRSETLRILGFDPPNPKTQPVDAAEALRELGIDVVDTN